MSITVSGACVAGQFHILLLLRPLLLERKLWLGNLDVIDFINSI